MWRLISSAFLVLFTFIVVFMITTAGFDVLCRQTSFYEDGFTHE